MREGYGNYSDKKAASVEAAFFRYLDVLNVSSLLNEAGK